MNFEYKDESSLSEHVNCIYLKEVMNEYDYEYGKVYVQGGFFNWLPLQVPSTKKVI